MGVIPILSPQLHGVVPRVTEPQTYLRMQRAPDGAWLALNWVHAVVCLLCSTDREWNPFALWGHKKGGGFRTLEVRHVYPLVVDDVPSQQTYRTIMFGLGIKDADAGHVKEVIARYQRWRAGRLCWNHDEYQDKLAEVKMHARTLKLATDVAWAGHGKVIGSPVESEAFGRGAVLNSIDNQKKGVQDDGHIKLPGTWGA